MESEEKREESCKVGEKPGKSQGIVRENEGRQKVATLCVLQLAMDCFLQRCDTSCKENVLENLVGLAQDGPSLL